MKTSQNFRESVSNNKLKAEKLKSFWREGEKKRKEKPSRFAFLNSRVITRLIAGPKRARRKKRKKTHLKCRHGNFYTRYAKGSRVFISKKGSRPYSIYS